MPQQTTSRFVCYESKSARPFRLYGLAVSPTSIVDRITGFLRLKTPQIRPWIDYNTFAKEAIPVPPSYYKIKMDPSVVAEKYCGPKRRLQRNNPEFQKIKKIVTKNASACAIVDNGGCPFIVYILGKELWVFQEPKNRYILTKDRSGIYLNDKWMYVDLVCHVKECLHVWTGRDRTTFPNDGVNSLLVQLTPEKYLFIGEMIYSFDLPTSTEIVKYVSTMGPNASPYPYAIDRERNAYLFLEKKKIRLHNSQQKPYAKYYRDHKGQTFRNIKVIY